MNNRERYFALVENKPVDRLPFFPDITPWFLYTRQEMGKEGQMYEPGEYIPDDSPLYSLESSLSGERAKMTFVDFYREHDWGLPVHMYGWLKTGYDGGIEEVVTHKGRDRIVTLRTPKGDLWRRYTLASDGSWAPRELFAKSIDDLEILKYVADHTVYSADYERIERFLRETEGFGVCDLPIFRSPFGKLVHEFLGFSETVFGLYDEPEIMEAFMEVQAESDMKAIELAVKSPANVIILSDHADENLISPPHYQQYCAPFYRRSIELLKKHNKHLSTHLDGNMKGFLPFISDVGFSVLDGCTPAPMFNYTVDELAAATKDGPLCYCGVPSSLFTIGLPTQELVDFGVHACEAFDDRVLVNVGDVLPANGDIDQVIAVGEGVMSYRLGK